MLLACLLVSEAGNEDRRRIRNRANRSEEHHRRWSMAHVAQSLRLYNQVCICTLYVSLGVNCEEGGQGIDFINSIAEGRHDKWAPFIPTVR